MIKPEWHFMLNEKYEEQETNNRPTSKKARKSSWRTLHNDPSLKRCININ